MRKLMVCILVFQLFIFTGILFGKAASSSSWLEAEIEYFENKEYKGNERIYTEVDFYPPYLTQGEADKEDILRYLRLLRNEVFARRGFIFGSEDLKGFFGGMSWYKSELKRVELDQIEKSNVSRIQKEEERYKSGEVIKEEYKEGKYKSKEEGRPGNAEEKYVQKVIVEAKWGSGLGEFGMDTLSAPPGGPGNLIVDEKGNIFIFDCGNKRIYKYDSQGILIRKLNIKTENIVRFTVKSDTIYAVMFTGLSPIEKVKMIDVGTGEVIKTLQISLPESNQILEIENEEGNILISRGENERYKLGGFGKQGKVVTAIVTRISKHQGTFTKLNQTQGEFKVSGHNLIISNVRGSTLLSAQLLGRDRRGNFYIEVWSEAPLKSPYPAFEEIIKYSPKGELLACIDLPLNNRVGKGIQIAPNEDIYYLYPTGKIIEKNWKIHFIPDKIKVIKWELQR